MYRRHTFSFALLASMLLLFVATACVAPSPPQSGNDESVEAVAQPANADEKITIKLAENPWSASALNVAIARILLEEQLDYPVEVVTIGESAQWPALANGDLHASLEVWPSGHADNVAEYIDNQKLVEDGGPLGPIGKIGWYCQATYSMTIRN